MLLAVLTAAAALATDCSCPTTDCPYPAAYEAYRARYNRPDGRCKTFCKNLDAINAHNADPLSTYRVVVRPLHDLSNAERFDALALGGYLGPKTVHTDVVVANATTYPPPSRASVDWFVQDRVNNVRDQQQCGDCWAESATVLLESMWYQQSWTLEELSVQQSAECPGPENNQGCEGGWPIDVLRYAQNSTYCTEQEYPTVIGSGVDVDCNSSTVANCTVRFDPFDIVKLPTEDLLVTAAAADVVSVAIDASGQGFYGFASGVYDGMYNRQVDCSADAIDHAVVVVGYDTYYGKDGLTVPFYIVRNSWGASYGMSGHIMMTRGINVCGIAQDAVAVLPKP